MKKQKHITKLAATVAMAVASIVPSFAQTNLGASCGCPSVNSRPAVNMSTLADANGNLLANNTVLDCAHNWVMNERIFVPGGKTLTVNPGTVVKAKHLQDNADSAVVLVVERDAKIIADGSADCPIVFTSTNDPMDGSYPISNKEEWGGILLAGRATNNMTYATSPYTVGSDGHICVADGLGIFEGFAGQDPRLYFGADLNGTVETATTPDDNDNSGIIRYVSVRYGGALLNIGAEINGITLGSVGRGTTMEHFEVTSCGDDGMEFFGGTVNIKYYSNLFGNDDNFDWDDGYSGKVQFAFCLQADTSIIADGDNGFEEDADDGKSNNIPRSHPIIYNCTMIGDGKKVLTSDNSGLAAMEAKELTEGETYNCVFSNFHRGFNVIKALGTGRSLTAGGEAWDNWQNGTQRVTAGGNPLSLKVKCNVFVHCDHPLTVDKVAPGAGADSTQFFGVDGNTKVSSVPGFDYTFAINGNTDNAVTHQYNAVPNPALSTAGCPVTTPPSDGFFVPTNYKGAFDPGAKNWLSQWSYLNVLNATPGLALCPTDINGDGVTNNADFLILLGQFNQNCH